MPETGKTRIVLPERIQRGDVIRVQVVIQHPMDTGFFRDANAATSSRRGSSATSGPLRRRRGRAVRVDLRDQPGPDGRFQLRAEQEGPLTVISQGQSRQRIPG